MSTAPRRRGERGAAAVEAALISSVVLVPLMLGVLFYGNWFWQAQKVEPLASRLPVDSVSGTFTCQQLVDAVRTTLLANLGADSLGLPAPVQDVTVEVVKVLPSVGAYVHVSLTVPSDSVAGGLVPLPHGGSLVSEATYRLNDVVVTTETCR